MWWMDLEPCPEPFESDDWLLTGLRGVVAADVTFNPTPWRTIVPGTLMSIGPDGKARPAEPGDKAVGFAGRVYPDGTINIHRDDKALTNPVDVHYLAGG